MTRKTKKKVTKDGRGHGRRKFTPWDSDRKSTVSASSLDVLMAWLTNPRNAERWRQEKAAVLCREIITTLKKNGILHRELSDVRTKIYTLEKKFASAAAHLSGKGQTDAFQQGEADQEVVTEVLKLCPLYRELVPVFGRIRMHDGTNRVATAAASGADKNNETISLPPVTIPATGGSKSAAGKWKESLEKGRHNVETHEKIQSGNRGKVVEKTLNGANGGQKRDAADGDEMVERKSIQSRTIDNCGAGTAINAVHAIASAAAEYKGRGLVVAEMNQVKEIAPVAMENKSSDADGKDEIGGAGQHLDAVVEEVDEVIVAAVEDDDGEQSIDDDDGNGNVLEQEKAQVSGGSAVESSGGEDSRQVHAHPKVSRILKTKQQLSESERSSSEEDDSEEETREREEEHDDDDGEEQIQLAQRDDVAEGDGDEEEEIAELIEVDEDEENITKIIEADEEDNKEVEIDDQDKNEVEEMEEVEETEAEEEPGLGGAKTEKSESSSSESESEGGDNEEEVSPTQKKTASDLEEESDHESNHDERDDDADLEEDTQQSTIERQPTRKRSNSGDSFSLSTKRAREDSSATRDLEREAFIERATQERVQRDELFQLERAKLACELQAKQVQLAMERCLARKKLLGAGVDPVEVDRILPL